MLAVVVVGRWEVWHVCWIRRRCASQPVQLQQDPLRDVRPGVTVGVNCFLFINQCRAHTSELLVHSVDFLAVLLCLIRFLRFIELEWATPAADYQKVTVIIFGWGAGLKTCFGACLSSYTWAERIFISQRSHSSSHVTTWSRNGLLFLRWRNTRHISERQFFLISHSSWRCYLSSFLEFPIYFRWLETVMPVHRNL